MNYKILKLIPILIICLIYPIFISGCNMKDKDIKIGILGTMSGINSDLSVSGRRGVEIAIDEINKEGGINSKKIQLVIKDDKNYSNIASNAYKEFVKENVAVVIGPYTSGMIINSMDYVRNNDILLLGPTISADSLSYVDDNFIRFIASTKEQAFVLAGQAKTNNDKKFAVIYDIANEGFNEALYNNFKSELEKSQGEVVLLKTFTSNNDVNYSSLANSITESKAEAVFIIADSADNAALTQQIRKIGCKFQIYSPLWSNTDELIKKGGDAVEGMFIVGGIDINDKRKEFLTFKDKYLDKYGENPTFSSVYSYEAAKALFEAMKMGPDLNSITIKNNIIKIKDFKGLEGDFEIDKYGDNTRKYMIFQIINGQLKKVG